MINKIYSENITEFVKAQEATYRSIDFNFWTTSIHDNKDNYLFDLEILSIKEEFKISPLPKCNDEYSITHESNTNDVLTSETNKNEYQIDIKPDKRPYLFSKSKVFIISEYKSYDININYKHLKYSIPKLNQLDSEKRGLIKDVISSFLKSNIKNVEMEYTK